MHQIKDVNDAVKSYRERQQQLEDHKKRGSVSSSGSGPSAGAATPALRARALSAEKKEKKEKKKAYGR